MIPINQQAAHHQLAQLRQTSNHRRLIRLATDTQPLRRAIDQSLISVGTRLADAPPTLASDNLTKAA